MGENSPNLVTRLVPPLISLLTYRDLYIKPLWAFGIKFFLIFRNYKMEFLKDIAASYYILEIRLGHSGSV
jgi:hypothetical protein